MTKEQYVKKLETLIRELDHEIKELIKQAQKQEKLLKLYKKLIIVKDEIIIASLFNKNYNNHTEAKEIDLEMQIEELEK